MSNLKQMVKEDIEEFKKEMSKYVCEIEMGKRKSRSMKYVYLKYTERLDEGKAYNVKYEDYHHNMQVILYKIMDRHNSKSRVRLYVYKDNVELKLVASDSRHTADTYAKSRKKGKKDDTSNGIELNFVQRDEGAKYKKEERGGSLKMLRTHEIKVFNSSERYNLTVDLRELQSESKNDYLHIRINDVRKQKLTEISKCRKLKVSEIVNQLINDVSDGKIIVD